MDHITTYIEQLDLAAQQLKQDNPAYRRFALILTDNIVELMCFGRCENEFWLDDILQGFGKYPKGKKREVLDADFKDRLNFLHSIGALTVEHQTFTGQAHSYRNESYHTGIVHDDIMHALAWHYHRVACELFVTLRHSHVCDWNGNQSAAWVKHGGSEDLYRGEEEAYKRVTSSLGAARPLPEPNLSDALATSVITRLRAIQEAIDYLVSDSPKKMNEVEVIRDIQYWDAFGKRFTGEQILSTDTVAVEAAMKHVEYLKNEWKPKYLRSPIPGWIGRAERLRGMKNAAHALQNFASLRREIEPFGGMAFASAGSLGTYIDEQVDRAKEKRAFGAQLIARSEGGEADPA